MRRFFFAAFCCITALQLSAQGYLETSYTPSRDFLDKDRNVHGQGELWQVRGMYTHNFSTKLNDEGQPIVWAGTLSGMYARLKNEGFAAEYNPGQILNLSFNVSHIRPLTRKNPRWYMIASLGAGIYSAPNDIAWRSWLVNGGLIFAYKLRDNLDVGIGAGLTNSFGVPLVMPMTFVKWTSTGEYEILIEATANIKASIARQFTDKFKLALIPCEMGGMSSVFREDGKNKLYSVMQMKAYLRPEYKLGKHSSVYLNAGMDLFHSVNITDRSIKGFADNFNKEERWKFKQAFNILVGYNYSF